MSENTPERFKLSDDATVDETIKSIYLDSPFYGAVLTKVYRESSTIMDTACVTLDRKLLVNPTFWDTLTGELKKGIIIHEILHLAMLHFPRFKSAFDDEFTRKAANIATDCAINQLIPELASAESHGLNLVTRDWVAKTYNINGLRAFETAEYYLERITNSDVYKKEVEQDKQSDADGGGGDGGGDKQSQQHQSGPSSDDLKKMSDAHAQSMSDENTSENDVNVMKGILENARRIEAADKRSTITGAPAGYGTSNSLLDLLPSYVHIDKKVWRHLITKALRGAPDGTYVPVYGRKSRRCSNSVWGKRANTPSSHAYVGIDTSMSITADDLSKFVGHIKKAIKTMNVTIDVIWCDTEVVHVDKKVKRIGDKVTAWGGGGTDLTKIQDYILDIEKNKKTRLILLTDGYTVWRDEPSIKTTVIYTKTHQEIPYVGYSSVLEE